MRFWLSLPLIAWATLVAVPEYAHAAKRNSQYSCSPGWPEGDRLVVDWVNLHVTFPNGSEMDMSDLGAPTGFRIGEADTEISGANTEVVTVHEGGEPDRVCSAR